MLRITKYHGLGNDFVIVNHRDVEGRDLSALALNLCDRHTGIGADGLISIKQSPLEMIYYNSDGSRAKMCGNGIRCFAKYIYDESIETSSDFEVITLAGIIKVKLKNRKPFTVEVNMGSPDFNPQKIPVIFTENEILEKPIDLDGKTYKMTSLFMGVTHSVIEVDDLDSTDMKSLGKILSNLPIFPDRSNINFYQPLDYKTIRMQTYERGVGMTLACGTGACATMVVANRFGKVGKIVTVKLPLGELIIELRNNTVFMTGTAEKILDGFIEQ